MFCGAEAGRVLARPFRDRQERAVRGLERYCGLGSVGFTAARLFEAAPRLAGRRVFGSRECMREKGRNEMGVKPLKTNDPAKSLIRRPSIISKAYDQQCETAHFAMRNIRFVFVCFGLRRRRKRNRQVGGPSAWGGSDYGTQRHRARAQSPDLAVGQFIGWRQAWKSRPEKSCAKKQLSP
jgi:hypothetical protein